MRALAIPARGPRVAERHGGVRNERDAIVSSKSTISDRISSARRQAAELSAPPLFIATDGSRRWRSWSGRRPGELSSDVRNATRASSGGGDPCFRVPPCRGSESAT